MKKTTLSKPWPVISLALLVALGGYIGCMTASGSESVNAPVIEPNAADASPTYFSYSTDEVIPLSGSTLTAHDSLGRPMAILKVGPYLAIGDNQVDPPLHIIRASDGAYVQSIGGAGEGPGEFKSVWSLALSKTSPSSFWAYDIALRRMIFIDLAQYDNKSVLGNEPMVKIRSNGLPTGPVWISDTLFTSTGFFSAGRIGHYNKEGKMLQIVGFAPDGDPDIPTPVRQHAYQSTLKSNPDGSLLVLGTRHADQLEIYQPDGTRLAVIRGPVGFEPAYGVGQGQKEPFMIPADHMRFGYVDLATTDTYIFALYSGRTRAEYPHTSNFGEFVHVFDWTGALQAVYQLDTDVLTIETDEKGQVLYGIQHHPQPEIRVYNLKENHGPAS